MFNLLKTHLIITGGGLSTHTTNWIRLLQRPHMLLPAWNPAPFIAHASPSPLPLKKTIFLSSAARHDPFLLLPRCEKHHDRAISSLLLVFLLSPLIIRRRRWTHPPSSPPFSSHPPTIKQVINQPTWETQRRRFFFQFKIVLGRFFVSVSAIAIKKRTFQF